MSDISETIMRDINAQQFKFIEGVKCGDVLYTFICSQVKTHER